MPVMKKQPSAVQKIVACFLGNAITGFCYTVGALLALKAFGIKL